MLFLTGDTHGDFTRFRPDIFPEQKQMTKQDYVIVLGDFGGVWDGSKEEQNWLDWLEAKPFTTLFVSGNHENYDLLASYPIQSWKGGRVQVIRPSVFHLMRGEVFTPPEFWSRMLRIFAAGKKCWICKVLFTG